MIFSGVRGVEEPTMWSMDMMVLVFGASALSECAAIKNTAWEGQTDRMLGGYVPRRVVDIDDEKNDVETSLVISHEHLRYVRDSEDLTDEPQGPPDLSDLFRVDTEVHDPTHAPTDQIMDLHDEEITLEDTTEKLEVEKRRLEAAEKKSRDRCCPLFVAPKPETGQGPLGHKLDSSGKELLPPHSSMVERPESGYEVFLDGEDPVVMLVSPGESRKRSSEIQHIPQGPRTAQKKSSLLDMCRIF